MVSYEQQLKTIPEELKKINEEENALAKEYHFSLDTPFKDYSDDIKNLILYGTNGRKVSVHYVGQRGVGDYDVTFYIISNEGCKSSIKHTVIIEEDLEFPNIITPNKDGLNDVFAVKNFVDDIALVFAVIVY